MNIKDGIKAIAMSLRVHTKRLNRKAKKLQQNSSNSTKGEIKATPATMKKWAKLTRKIEC